MTDRRRRIDVRLKSELQSGAARARMYGAVEKPVTGHLDTPTPVQLSLLVHLEGPAGPPNEAAILQDAVHQYFSERRKATERRLKQLFRVGRISLLIGLAALVAALGASQLIAKLLSSNAFSEVLRESPLIGGWVAMWRPIEVFLYDWWPIRADARLFERLSSMPVRIKHASSPMSDASR